MKDSAKFLLLVLVMSVATKGFGQEKNDPTRWTIDDIVYTESMSSVSISPDESMVLWTKRKPVKDKDQFVSDIYLTLLNQKKDGNFRTVQLTHGDDNDYSPIFSKDGESIYFLSSREKGNKLWKLSIYGGEAQKVNEFRNGISSLQWKDEHTLLFRSNDGKTLLENQLEKKKDNVVIVEDSTQWKPSHVYAFNTKTKSIRRLTDNSKPIGYYSVSSDGKWLVYSMQRSRSYASDAQMDPYYYLQNLENGEKKQILMDRKFPVNNVQFSKDNKGFYFISNYASDPKWNGAGISELYYFTMASMTYQKVNLQWPMGISRGYRVVGNDVIASLANKATLRLAHYRKGGNNWTFSKIDLKEKNDHVVLLGLSDKGKKVVYTYSTPSKLPAYYIANVANNSFQQEKELIVLNKKICKKPLTKSEVITWKGYKGEEVTGILFYPENYQKGKKYPLMLSIHGGPASMDLDMWRETWTTYPNILAQKGLFVLRPNYHGSSNHGLAFVESIKGNYYEPKLEDITKGIAHLNNQGMIDMDQLGTMGWSNGAIITTMLTVKYPDMFKVAAPGAGDVNWTSDYGTCRFGVSFDQSYFGGAPWDDVNGKVYNEDYILKSPLFEIEKIKTPTIIFHGSEDRAVPRDQGWEYYRGLQQVGKAPVRFLWFPGQPHGLRKISHQKRKMKEEIAWIETYLLNKKVEENVAFKENSPIAEVLKLQKAKLTNNGLFGEVRNGLLLPETVSIKADSTSIGRFEITNAQFRAFRPQHTFDAGLDNYPAVVSRSSAQAYVKWLSSKTGETYRLPNKKEAEALHKQAHKVAGKEITLNYWAGYDITRNEVSSFLKKLNKAKMPLIKKVGKKKSTKVGEAVVYDLGGNVAEYYSEGIYGYSAYDFHDKNDDRMVDSKHVGIRVIKE